MTMKTAISRSDRLTCSGRLAVGPEVSRQFVSPLDAVKNRSHMQRAGIARALRNQPASRLAIILNRKQKFQSISTVNVVLDDAHNVKGDEQNTGSPEVSNRGIDMQSRHALTLMDANGPCDASFTQHMKNGYRDLAGNDAIGNNFSAVRDVGSYQTFDKQVSLKGVNNLDTVPGVNTVTEFKSVPAWTEARFQTGFEVEYTKPLARSFYARAKYKFW